MREKVSVLNISVVYLVIYLILIIYYVLYNNNFKLFHAIKLFGATSAIFISFYYGLKLSRYRLKKVKRVIIFIERIHLSSKAIIGHICLVFIALVIISFVDDNVSEDNMYKAGLVDQKIVTMIEEAYDRTDISNIVVIDDSYLVTFSDESRAMSITAYNNMLPTSSA